MKKLSLLLVAFFIITLSSCHKAGVYEPKEKISKIYTGISDEKYLSEAWNWNNKQLRSIDYYGVLGGITNTEEFFYNSNGQLVTVKSKVYKDYTEYTYKGRKLDRARSYRDGVNTTTFIFEYDDNELSDITLVYNDAEELKSLSSEQLLSPIKYILPNVSLASIDKLLENVTPVRGSVVIELDLEWRNRNVVEIEFEYNDKYAGKVLFKHDDMKNPFRNFFGLDFEDNFANFANKNNVVEITYVSTLISGTENIYYTYDGKYPVTKEVNGLKYHYEYE